MRCRNQANGREHDLQCPQKAPRGEALGWAVTRRLEFSIASKAPQISCHLGIFSKAKIKGAGFCQAFPAVRSVCVCLASLRNYDKRIGIG